MYSEPIARAALIQHMPASASEAGQPDAQAVRAFIRAEKADGRLIERRVFVDPARSRKRRQVFQYVAVNLELDF